MTINVIRANVDDWTTFFVDLEVSTRGDFCCLSYFIKASLNFSLSRQIHFYSLQYFFSDVLFGKNDNCITRKCAECTTNQHCSSGKYCSRYKCVIPPNNQCNNESDCPGDSECRWGSCQLCSGQRFAPSIGNIIKAVYVSFLLSGQTGSFLGVLEFLQLKGPSIYDVSMS